MALLGLVRLLRQSGPAILSLRPRGRSLRLPLEARKRAGAPQDTWRVVVRRMIGRVWNGCQTTEASRQGGAGAFPGRPGTMVLVRVDVPAARARRSARIPLGSMCESPCDAVLAGAILSGPSAPETFAGDASRPRGGSRQRSSGLVGSTSIGRFPAHAPRPGPWPAALYRPVNPERRSYRTNGRQAGLASRPG